MPDFMLSNKKTNIRQGINQDSGFHDLLLRQTRPVPTSGTISTPIQENEKNQLDKTYRQLKKLLPDEVLDILHENDGLQEEIIALVMQSLSSQQGVSPEEQGEQKKLLKQQLFPLKQAEQDLEVEADLQEPLNIYNEIVNLLQGIDKIADTDQPINQMAYQLFNADLSEETETNDAEESKSIEEKKVLQDLNQFIVRADSVTAEQIIKQAADLLIASGLLEEKAILVNTGQADIRTREVNSGVDQQARVQQLIHVISRQMQKSDSAVAEQTAKQIINLLQDWNMSEEMQIQRPKAAESELVREGLQRIEPKIAAWLQTSLQDASPAVFKHESLPISRVEQFIVNMGQTDSTKALSGKELIDKIESLVQSQRLYNFVRGQNPISIQLRPENLGDMTIRFVQSNGELTVQMIVSSKAVKEVLESNLHQLRNVFSPHQVTIEKQDNIMLSNAADASKNSKENQNEQQQADHYEDSSEANEQEQYSETESFESFMEKLLSQNEEEQMQS